MSKTEDKLSKILTEHQDGFSPADRDFIANLLEQILYARYFGGADFPVGHPERGKGQFEAFNRAFTKTLFNQNTDDLIDCMENSKPVINL
jgi:hypothetical protein|tara:strand:+ start:3218 stop:3487 length:270 start_codon:yes stop_codon:yes gene_type:complete